MNTKYQELKLDQYQIEDFRSDVLTPRHMLGSKVFEFTNKRYDHELYQMLFNQFPRHLYEQEGHKPAIILGRRGSGKSSYLNFLSHKPNIIDIAVKSWEIVDLVESQITQILQKQKTIASEKVAEIWQLVFLVLATKKIREIAPDDYNSEDFLKELPLGKFLKGTAVNVVTGVLDHVKNKYLEKGSSNFDISILCHAMGLGENTLDDWEMIIHRLAQRKGKKIIILIDNPERLKNKTHLDPLAEAYREASKPRWFAYSGLLRLLANFNEGRSCIQARFCVPSEQFFFLQERSEAYLKDFANVQVLSWTSGDLLSLVAHRYMVFLQLHPELRNQERYEQLLKADIYDRVGAMNFFREIIQGNVKNGRGYNEDPIPYILRHTQLLPRQILFYFNKVIELSLISGQKDFTKLDASLFVRSINECEGTCAKEIIHSYIDTYPEGLKMMDRLDNFPLHCSLKVIRDNWTKYGAKGVLKKFELFPGMAIECDRFLRFLIETGIIGRVDAFSGVSGKGYLNTEFEYTLPEKMTVNSTDKVAVHPIFLKQLGRTNIHDIDPYIAVYPKGTEILLETEN